MALSMNDSACSHQLKSRHASVGCFHSVLKACAGSIEATRLAGINAASAAAISETVAMNGTSYQLLSCAGLSGDQHS
jgi:hypothetical protein